MDMSCCNGEILVFCMLIARDLYQKSAHISVCSVPCIVRPVVPKLPRNHPTCLTPNALGNSRDCTIGCSSNNHSASILQPTATFPLQKKRDFFNRIAIGFLAAHKYRQRFPGSRADLAKRRFYRSPVGCDKKSPVCRHPHCRIYESSR